MATEVGQYSGYNYTLGKLQHMTSYSFCYHKTLTWISSKHNNWKFLIHYTELAKNDISTIYLCCLIYALHTSIACSIPRVLMKISYRVIENHFFYPAIV